jgi:hypothetical protein
MKDLSRAEKEEWAMDVAISLLEKVPREETRQVTLLAGEDYRKLLVPQLLARGYDVFVPMEGMAIGKQMNWLGRGVEGPPDKPTGTPLKEITVQARAIREKTGEIIKVEKDAETALRDVDETTSIYQQLLECLKS